MSDPGDDAERLWLVERSYDDRNVVTLVYATTDGDRALTRELSPTMVSRTSVTAAREVDPDRLSRVEDRETRERYATEAARMADRHEPDEAV